MPPLRNWFFELAVLQATSVLRPSWRVFHFELSIEPPLNSSAHLRFQPAGFAGGGGLLVWVGFGDVGVGAGRDVDEPSGDLVGCGAAVVGMGRGGGGLTPPSLPPTS